MNLSRIETLRAGKQPVGLPEIIGNTPILSLDNYLDRSDVELCIKLEALNPGGSAKDRPARQMIEEALRIGQIDQNSTIIESSSGNMGIGLAQTCAFYGLKLIIVVDPNAQKQNLAIIRALGAEVKLVKNPVNGDFLTARLQVVSDLLKTVPGAFWPNQYRNPQNPLAHYLGTVREIDDQTDGELDYLFVATSSTGTARGCRDLLAERGRDTKVIAIDAEGSALFGGTPGPRYISGLGAGTVPPLAIGQEFFGLRRVSDVECVVGCRRMAQREAMLVGGSAGGVLESVRAYQDQLAGKKVAALLHDSGTRYLETVFDDEWVERKLGVDPATITRLVNQRNAEEYSLAA